MKRQKIVVVVMHTRPHLDEILAVLLLTMFGKKKYSGISRAKIECWSKGVGTPDGRSFKDYEKEGYLFIGIGGGEYDEYTDSDNGYKRIQTDCASTLVAKDLGIEDDPGLEKILEFVFNTDSSACAHPFDISTIVKVINDQFPDNPEKAIKWAIMALKAKYQDQLHFIGKTKAEFEKKAEIDDVLVNRTTLKVVTIESDEEQMSKFARSSLGCLAAVVIQKTSSGNVQIYTNRKYGLRITDIVKMMRWEEQQIKGGGKITNWDVLGSEGKVDGIPEWFYHSKGQMLLNGSKSAPNVPATRISLERIKKLVKIGVNSNDFLEHCRDSRKCIYKKCDRHCYGLQRCKRTRYLMKNPSDRRAIA